MISCIMQKAEVGGRAVYDVGLRPLDCWDPGFESRCGQTCPSIVFVVCCVDSSFCDELTARSESYRFFVCEI
jgi:hypothetical protein